MIFQIMCRAQANELILKDPVKLADKARHAPRKSRKDSLHLKDSKKQFNSTEEFTLTTAPTAFPMQYSSCNSSNHCAAFYLLAQQKSPEILRFQDFLWSE